MINFLQKSTILLKNILIQIYMKSFFSIKSKVQHRVQEASVHLSVLFNEIKVQYYSVRMCSSPLIQL